MELKKATESESTETIRAKFDPVKDFKLEPAGYFLIRYIAATQEIEAGFCKKDNVIEKKFVGKNAEELYNTILREIELTVPAHIAYLGKELKKAEIAMKLGIEYVQDSPLDLSGLRKED